MKQEKKEKIGWWAFLAASVGIGIANLVFIFYCIAFFFDSKFGYGAAVPSILLYIFANVAAIMILTEVMNWGIERGD